MNSELPRRDFLKSVPAAAYALGVAANGSVASPGLKTRASIQQVPGVRPLALETFEYNGVTLGASRWKRQVDEARAFYLAVPNDDILHGFRKAAGLAAPGKPLGGWCGVDSNIVFGQWLSGMSRLSRATGDAALREKALTLFAEWSKTVGADGNFRMDHYAFDKLVCGLVDLSMYAGSANAEPMLARVTAFAAKTFQRPLAPLADINDNQGYYGRPQEWYTLGENLLRAYTLTGDAQYLNLAREWMYPLYWNKFLSSSSPVDAHGVHAYSHVNTFSSLAMLTELAMGRAATAEITRQPSLDILRNFYDYMQKSQCYATGGYGPNERFMKTDGSLGRALDTRSDTFEAVCGSWAGFKLSKYLMRLTGEARYGDWIERLFYNGVGAALHVTGDVRNFYYADYRVGGGMKVYNWDTCTCCSGTYIQNMAEYHNLIYLKDARGLSVNLYVPSEVVWNHPIEGGKVSVVRVKQETKYPDAETTRFTLELATPTTLALRFRVPGWCAGMSATVNGAPVAMPATPGTWATIDRAWKTGDVVELKIPLTMRMEPVDAQHPDRVAVVRGPVVIVLEGAYHDPNFRLPMRDEDLSTWLVPETEGTLARGIWSVGMPPPSDPVTVFRVVPPDKSFVRLRFRPFYETGENYPYFMYFDRKSLPWKLW